MRDNAPVPSDRGLLCLTILDDNPFVRTPAGTIHPRAATFHRFAETIVREGPFERARYLVPVRDATGADASPALPPIDTRWLRVVPTAPFEGAAGFLSRAPSLTRANRPLVRAAVRSADLVWMKVPASNAPLAAILAALHQVPRFTYVAGRALEVVRGQGRAGPASAAALAAAAAYDLVTSLLRATGPSVTLDQTLFTSTLTADEMAPVSPHREPPGPGEPWRIGWAGRMAAEKGLGDLLSAFSLLRTDARDAQLHLIGDGPVRAALEQEADRLGLTGSIRWHGYLGDRATYFDALRSLDLFCLPSHAEGVPKALIDALGAGVPVVATDVGRVRALLDDGELGLVISPGDPAAIAGAMSILMDDPARWARLREAGLASAVDRTAEAQARRLIGWMERTFPRSGWEEAWAVRATLDGRAGDRERGGFAA